MRGQPRPSSVVHIRILDRNVVIQCTDPRLHRIIAVMFRGFPAGSPGREPDLQYSICTDAATGALNLARAGRPTLHAHDDVQLMHLLDKDITIELQRARKELYFLHAAAISRNGNAWLLASASGGGKSTLTWALLHHGLGYLSDELAPIDLHRMRILPYPRALILKQVLPAYPPPPSAIRLDSICYIAPSFPDAANGNSTRLAGVFFVSRHPAHDEPRISRVSPPEAAARMYTVALNALAHACHGLEAAVHIAESVPCFALASADLMATSILVRSVMDQSETETRRN
jgi:hypothetical protein